MLCSNEAWNFGVFQALPSFVFDTIFDISEKLII